MVKVLLKYAAILISFFSTVSAYANCTVEHAHYEMVGDGSWHVNFKEIRTGYISDLALEVRSEKSGDSFWFLFDAGAGSYIHLISTTDVNASGWKAPESDGPAGPLGSMLYFAFSPDLLPVDAVPQPKDVAPGYVFLPDLAEVMWMKASPRQSASRGIFKFKKCD